MELCDYLEKIQPIDKSYISYAEKRWYSIAKPIRSMGMLENAISRICAVSKSKKADIQKAALVIMCADHGVVEEGVTQTGYEITKLVADNFESKDTPATVMAKCAGADVFPVDVAIKCEPYNNKNFIPFKVCDRKISKGSKNIAKENAMTRSECESAILVGIEAVGELKRQGYGIIATGEMGIGNTTPSSALAAILLKKPSEEVTGKGAGLSEKGIENKTKVVKKIIERAEKEKISDAVDLLSCCGGYEIAAMTGLFIGGAVYGVPVISDGFISNISALIAVKIKKEVKDYIFASHISAEGAAKYIIDELDLDYYIDCGMCLGEGTGAVAVLPLFKMTAQIYNTMSTFEDIHMESYIDYEKEEKKC